jgi:hypothetical protein
MLYHAFCETLLNNNKEEPEVVCLCVAFFFRWRAYTSKLFLSKNTEDELRQHLNLRQPLPSLTKYQKGVYYLGIKVFSVLPSYIKQESNSPKRFRLILKKFLYEN